MSGGQNPGRQGADPYAFDPVWYLQAYPDIRQADPNYDPLEHYMRHGRAEGRARNALEASGALNFQAGNEAPGRGDHPRLDPNDPASWASFQQRGHASTQGLNRMPNVAPDTASLSRDPLAVQQQFYPHGPASTAGNAASAGAKGGAGFGSAINGGTVTVQGPGGSPGGGAAYLGNALAGGFVPNMGMALPPEMMPGPGVRRK